MEWTGLREGQWEGIREGGRMGGSSGVVGCVGWARTLVDYVAIETFDTIS